ncbi:MAG TPA: MaoC family dehydratase N-terminal domain-containing protein [Verrucomicrobiae bacterium]|nr:MaoC family dehydratase N-terminal domain-containing protein [Verrucomicrobiae bacterium]
MALNPTCVGRRYVGAPQIVDGADARAFAAAVGVGDRIDPVPTYAAHYLLAPIASLLFADGDVGLDLPRLVHAEQTFAFERRPHVGEALLPEGTIAKVESRRGLDFLELDLCAKDTDGLVVTRATSVFVIRAGGKPRAATA